MGCDINFGTKEESFKGNGWVGRCKNCDSTQAGASWEESFCTCGGSDGCPCINMVKQATHVPGSPEYPEWVPSYGYGCKKHDAGEDMCAKSTATAEGKGDDWCEDKWCIVDPNNCDMKTREVGYTLDAEDHFSYGTCNTNTFAGNGWIGRCKTCESPFTGNSFCGSTDSSECPGAASCPCLPMPTDGTEVATQAADAPMYPTQVPAYGWGCAAHDLGYDACNVSAGADVTDGAPSDWCKSQWCKVDPNNCAFRSLPVGYTGQPDDSFSYEACDINFGTKEESFKGNGWVGRCKNCDSTQAGASWEESFCTCGGSDGCPCINMVKQATHVPGSPEYPEWVPSYGYGCKKHDAGEDMCAKSTATAEGQSDDWCEDKWCIVDPNNCDMKTREVGYTLDAEDHFSYGTCNTNTFAGNGWIGRCKTCESPFTGNSFCGSTDSSECPGAAS